MPWIKISSADKAQGFVASQHKAALARAGRIWGIVPEALVNEWELLPDA